MEDELVMTEDDMEEVAYLKKKISNIVEGKEHVPVKYENVPNKRRDSLRATANEIDFGSPSMRRNKSDYKKGTQIRMLPGNDMRLEDELPHLYENIEMPNLHK